MNEFQSRNLVSNQKPCDLRVNSIVPFRYEDKTVVIRLSNIVLPEKVTQTRTNTYYGNNLNKTSTSSFLFWGALHHIQRYCTALKMLEIYWCNCKAPGREVSRTDDHLGNHIGASAS